MAYPAHGPVLHDSRRRHDRKHTAPPATQAERFRMLKRGDLAGVARDVGITLDRPPVAAHGPLTELERYATVTTPNGRTYAAQPWPDDG